MVTEEGIETYNLGDNCMTNDDKQIKKTFPRSYKCLQGIKCSIGLTRSEVIGYKKNLRDILMGRVRGVGGLIDYEEVSSIMTWRKTPQGHDYWQRLEVLMGGIIVEGIL